MSDEHVERVFHTAMALAQTMVQRASSVDDLLALSNGDREVLDSARARAEAEAERTVATRTEDVGSEDVPEAPALLAAKLLGQAIDELDRGAGPS